MAWQCAQAQIKRFSQFLEKQQIDVKEYTEHPKHLLSLNSRLPSLNITGKKAHSQLDEPTSGESSPCVSESGRKQRHVAPSVHDVHDYFTNEETFSEVDYNIEEIQESQRDLALLIEGLDTSITIDRFLALMAEVRVYTYTVNCIFDTRKYKFVTFKGKNCLLLQIQIKSHTFFSRYVRKLQMHIKNSTGIAVGICVTKKAKHLNGVIVRSLPPKLSHQDLTEKCKKEVGENITVGSIHRIKQSNCCIIDCQYLEDAEKISKRINKSQFRDTKSQECYTVKAHVYPHNTLKHLDKDKSIFAENITFNIEPKITQKPAKSRKAEISRLIDIFANAKDPTPPRNPLTDLTQKENLSRNLTDSSSYIQEIKLKSAKNRVCITSYI